MPRTPDSANLKNRIRKLREQFQITQDRLGELLGMNGDAIRNLENGRMKINATVLRRIIVAVGAEYSTKREIWMVPLSKKRCDPATLMAWRQAAKPKDMQKRKDYEALASRIAVLLAYSRPNEYNVLFMNLSELLDDCLGKHPSPEAKEAFEKSTPRMTMRRIWKKDPKWKERALADDEDVSVAEEKGLPTNSFPYSNSEILGVARAYKNFPTAAELLPVGEDDNR
jgi:transcriptional regulator with XRE-family HTH domain